MMSDGGDMKIMSLAIALLAFVLMDTPAFAQGFGGDTRNYTVRGFERIRIDGPVRVELETGVPPYARAVGDQDAARNIDVRVNGETLVVSWSQSGRRGFRSEKNGPVTLKVGTRRIEQAWVNGAGQLDIDRVEIRKFGLSVVGAGGASIGEIEVDTLDVGVGGAANVTIAGEAKEATFVVRGMSVLEAMGIEVRDLTLGVEGPSFARVLATGQLELDAIGAVDIEIEGGPACTVRAQGPARITGC